MDLRPESKLIALLAALRHGNCDTTQSAEGQWTVYNDGFSLLEREKPVVAMALRLKPDEDSVATAERNSAAAREDIDLPVEDSDCGRFLCSTYVANEYDPDREAHVLSLSPTANEHDLSFEFDRVELESVYFLGHAHRFD